MTDVVEFIKTRLDEDERVAREATTGPWKVDDPSYAEAIHATDGTAVVAGGRWGDEGSCFETTEDALHIPRHDPARVLRDVEAKRQVLRLYTNAVSAVEHASGFQSQRTAIQDATCVEILGEALKSLALVWADHPDFRSEWCMADGGAEASE